MPTQILYTAIPDPTYSGPGVRLTIAISPRLIAPADGTLADFPLLLDWPALVDGMAMELELDGGLTAAVALAPPRHPFEARSSAVWQRVFPPDCLVRPWALIDLRAKTVHEFPATAIEQRLRELYRSTAAAGTALPRVLDVGDLDECGRDHDGDGHPDVEDPGGPPCQVHGYQPHAVDRMLLDYEDARDAMRAPWKLSGLGADARAIHDGLAFYGRATDADVDVDVTEPVLDFHQRVALCGDHPSLLRRLGLVFDVVTVEEVPLLATGVVRLRPDWRGNDPDDLTPWTRYVSAGGFRAAPAGLVADGYLTLGAGMFSVVQLDADGALLQLASTMASVRSMLTDPHGPPQHEQALPALRSGGLTLLHAGRAAWLADRLRRQAVLDVDPSATSDPLRADDLTRGVRLDLEVDGQWRSLHRRHGEVRDRDHVDGASPLLAIPVAHDEEGFVKLASATSPTFRPDHLYLHEAVTGCSGWSLSATRPGSTLEFVPAVVAPDGEVIEPARERTIENRNDPGSMPVTTRYRATPGSLPPLRFDQPYRVRCRAVDHAAGGLEVSDPLDAHALGPITYRRYEPVPPPVPVPQAPMREAESLEHVVVRTDPDGAPSYQTLTCARHLLAPKTSLELWERHGMLDGDSDLAALYATVQRERGSLLEPFIDTRAGRVAVTDRVLCNPASKPDQPTAWPARGAPLREGQYVISTGDHVRQPWLPDRMAAGVVLWNASAPATPPVIRRFQTAAGADPAEAAIELESLRIVLHAAAAGTPPRIRPGDELDREVHVDLPPGDRLELRYASLPRAPETMALWHLMTAADRAAVADAIREGRHWMFTPARTMTLVHAAQRPVVAPEFSAPITVMRAPGEARALLTTTVAAHAHSTSHVDLRARWLEVRDDGPTGATAELAEADVTRLAFAYDDTEVPTTTTVQLLERRPVSTNFKQLLRIVRKPPQFRLTYHELPDARRRIVTYTPIGTTRWQEYFPAGVLVDPHTPTLSNLQKAGAARTVSIPASAPPDAPHVIQILPTFLREGTAASRVRRGNGVRIYLAQPWFSSGVGERLAILIERAATLPPQPTPADWLEKVSRWAADPVWSWPAPVPQPLSAASFVIDPSDTVPAFGGLDARPRVELVSSINGDPVDAIVVVPEFSVERQQWYCDLELTTTSYFPFLSLALARYQDHSVHLRGLSPVVRAELVQLAPDRSASITVTPNGKRVDVRVRGVASGNLHQAHHAGNPGGAHRVRARVELPRASGNELEWRIHDELELTAQQVTADEVEWSGRLNTRPAQAWRVVIEESELYRGEDHGSGAPPGERISYVEILTRP